MMTSVSNQDGVGGREQREQGRLAPEATGRDPQRDRGAGEQGLTESLRRRHVPVTARHGGNADPEGGLDPGQDVTVGAVARATPAELGLEQGRILQGAGQEVG